MKNKKIIWYSSFSLFSSITIPISIVSCSKTQTNDETTNPEADLSNPKSTYYKKTKYLLNDPNHQNDNFSWNHNEILPDENKVTILDAVIVKWKDGDTVEIELNKTQNSEIKIAGKFNVRIGLIDTPEKGLSENGIYKESIGKEKKYSERATEFGKTILPPGSKIKFVYNGKGTPEKSYDRYVGFIFFGKENHYRDYSVEIIKAGLSLPNPNDYKNIGSSNDNLVEHYELWKATEALEFARKNKTGMWENVNQKSDIQKIRSEVYKMRGAPGGWTKLTKDLIAPNEENIYKYNEFLKKIK